MSMFVPTYNMAPNPPLPMAWDEYEAIVIGEWQALLDGSPSPDENGVQAFLERHPCMLPGVFNLTGGPSGHYPHFTAVIAQAPLPSYCQRIPDFVWLSQNSSLNEPVLVEIEAPGKPRWTKRGQPSAKLTQALDQIAQWKSWFQLPENVIAFKKLYSLDDSRTFRPAYALIHGRRAEANATSDLQRKREQLAGTDVTLMTYDRLRPDRNASQLFCVKVRSGEMHAVSVPPTMTWSPSIAEMRLPIRSKPAAIRANPYMTPDRKAFLCERADYWDEWARTGRRGVVNTGDRE